jgi:hypothetical protein
MEASDVLRLRCDANSIEVLTPVVEAQPDGVHVEADVTGLADPWVGLRSETEPSSIFFSGSDGVDDGFVRQVAPGAATVGCGSGPQSENDTGPFRGAFTVIDPNGVFIDYHADCGDRGTFAPDVSIGEQPSSAEDAIAAAVTGLRPSDKVEIAGYTGADTEFRIKHYRIVRGDRVIGSFIVELSGTSSYFVASADVCLDSGLHPA